MKYNRQQIMRRAHCMRAETNKPFADCLRAAWAEAKCVAPPALILPPVAQAALGAVAIVRKLRSAHIEIAARVHVDLGLRVTPKGEMPMAWIASKELAGGYERRP